MATTDRHTAEKDAARIARMLRLPAADERVSHLHMRAVAALIKQWEEDDADSDDYTRAGAAEDLRRVIAGVCTCRDLPHDRRCPTRVTPPVVPRSLGEDR